jgi:hypothetical protein
MAFHQSIETIVNGRYGDVRQGLFGSHEDLLGGWMIWFLEEHIINVLTLCREPQAACCQPLVKPICRRTFHVQLGHYLKSDLELVNN